MKIEAKQVILYAIAPALIAGLFSVAPKIYEIAIEPKASLTYSVVTGPQIAIEGNQQQVVSVKVSNNGKRPLTLVNAELSVEGGTVETYTLTNTSGLNIQVGEAKGRITMTIPKVHPGENLSVSALLKTTQPTVFPKFVLRSDEVLGILEASTPKEGGFIKTIQSAGLAALSVFAMALLALTRLKSGILSYKTDALFYIATATNIDNLVSLVNDVDDELTYMRFADMLLVTGQSGDNANHLKAITGGGGKN